MQKNILEYLEASAEAFPDKIAFKDPKEALTFKELEANAKAIGTALLKYSKGSHGHRIAVAVDRTAKSIAAFMGAVYSGGCYVPLDIQMPVERMKTILKTSMPTAIIDGTGKRSLPEEFKEDYTVLNYNELIGTEADEAALKKIQDEQTDVDPLYIIFTSGSTGTPKGVCVSHRSVIDFADWLAATMKVTSEDILGNQAPFYFDMAGKDIYLSLKCGCTVHILPHMLFSFTGKLMKKLNEEKITALFWAAAAVRMVAASGVLEKDPPLYVKKIGFGGEALPVRWLNCWKNVLPDAKLMNMYGPTEATIDCLYYIINKDFDEAEALPMGKPCENTSVLLIDENNKEITDPDVNGEICVRGSGLALGYFNDPGKTAKSFKQNPVNTAYPDLLYYTGDLARYGKDGLLYFAGRKDNQIKHQGYRIELGEIETKVNSLNDIDVGVCIFDNKNDEIVLFYQGTISEEDLPPVLIDLLPKYMQPSHCIKRKALPYNANNKIDRVKLKEEYLSGADN